MVEIAHHVRFSSRLKTTVKVINPAVVGADKGLPVARLGLADPGAAMPANVVHRVNLPVLAARDDDVVLANFQELVVARLWNFARVKRINPAFEN